MDKFCVRCLPKEGDPPETKLFEHIEYAKRYADLCRDDRKYRTIEICSLFPEERVIETLPVREN